MKKLCKVFEEYIMNARLKIQKLAVTALFSICIASLLYSWLAISKNQVPPALLICVKFALVIPFSFFVGLTLLTIILSCTSFKINDRLLKNIHFLTFIEKISLSGFYVSYLLSGIFICSGGLYLINHFSYSNLFMFLFISIYLVAIQGLMSIVTLFLLASLNTIKNLGALNLQILMVEPLFNFILRLKEALLEIIDHKTLLSDFRKFSMFPVILVFFIIWKDDYLYFRQWIGDYFLFLVISYLFIEGVLCTILAKISTNKHTENQITTCKDIPKRNRLTVGNFIALNRKVIRFSNFVGLSVFFSFFLVSVFHCLFELKFDAIMLILNQIGALFMITIGCNITNQGLGRLILTTHINKTTFKSKK